MEVVMAVDFNEEAEQGINRSIVGGGNKTFARVNFRNNKDMLGVFIAKKFSSIISRNGCGAIVGLTKLGNLVICGCGTTRIDEEYDGYNVLETGSRAVLSYLLRVFILWKDNDGKVFIQEFNGESVFKSEATLNHQNKESAMKDNNHVCNRVEGSSRCLRNINHGKCPMDIKSADNLDECRGRRLQADFFLTRPDSNLLLQDDEVVLVS